MFRTCELLGPDPITSIRTGFYPHCFSDWATQTPRNRDEGCSRCRSYLTESGKFHKVLFVPPPPRIVGFVVQNCWKISFSGSASAKSAPLSARRFGRQHLAHEGADIQNWLSLEPKCWMEDRFRRILARNHSGEARWTGYWDLNESRWDVGQT